MVLAPYKIRPISGHEGAFWDLFAARADEDKVTTRSQSGNFSSADAWKLIRERKQRIL